MYTYVFKTLSVTVTPSLGRRHHVFSYFCVKVFAKTKADISKSHRKTLDANI